MENRDTGLLLNKKNIELNRFYFKQTVKLIGINVLYRAPRKEQKRYDLHGELDALYTEPVPVGCIYNEFTDQKTMKKIGWNAERDETTPVIHVPYDLQGLEKGGLFEIPSGLDNAKARVFKVLDLGVAPIYPASVACKLGPMLQNELPSSQVVDFNKSDFNLLNDTEDEDEVNLLNTEEED